MLRVIGLMLIVVAGAAKVASAENRVEGPVATSIERGLHHGPTGAHAAGVQLQIGGGLAFAPAGRDDQRRAGLLDLARVEQQERGRDGRRLARGRTGQGRSEDWLNPGRGSQPGLAYPVNNALSLGVDYHYQSGESMNFKVAKVGGLEPNYHSHNIMIEARLEF